MMKSLSPKKSYLCGSHDESPPLLFEQFHPTLLVTLFTAGIKKQGNTY